MAKKARTGGEYAHYDVEVVKAAATRRWPDILVRLGGIAGEKLNGKHHSCPKCQGVDRFRYFDDDTGGAFCNKCHRERCGDGFATIEWMTGHKFYTVVGMVAEYLGVPPQLRGPGRPRKDGSNADPAADLEFQEWNDSMGILFGIDHPPITSTGIQLCGGRIARYKDRYTVLALPVWGESLTARAPVGWCLYNLGGRTLPRGPRLENGGYEQVKVKLTFGSAAGIIGPIEQISKALGETATPATFYKTEGPSDLLAWLSLPDAPLAWTNANGTMERPPHWIPKLFAGTTVHVVHDADEPGQEGATYRQQSDGRYRPGWCPLLAEGRGPDDRPTLVKNIILPYPIAETHGKDLRDWLNEGNGLASMQALADETPAFTPRAAVGEGEPGANGMTIASSTNEAPDNFHRLARINIFRYAKSTPNNDGTLRFYKNQWYKYDGRAYKLIDDDELRAKIGAAVKEEFDRVNIEEMAEWNGKGKPPAVRNVGCALIANVIFAMAQMRILSGSVKLNSWIDGPFKGDTKRRFIAVRNGILNLDALLSGEDDYLLPHSPDWFGVNCLPFDFDPEAQCPKWHNFLKKNIENDAERISILMEWAGYLLLPTTNLQKFMLMEGEGANGKSVYMAAIEAMIGPENCCHVPLESFSSDFMRAQIVGKMLNIASECSEMDAIAEGFLKGVASGDPMTMNRKNLPPIEHTPTARLMLSTNVRPRFADKSNGLWRRVLLMPWRITVREEDRVLGMDTVEWWQESNELPGIFNWALAGLHQLRENRRFTKSAVCEAALADYKKEVNPAKGFLEENYVADPIDGAYVSTQAAYVAYDEWCKARGYRPVSDKTFGREVARAFPRVRREQRRNPVDRTRFYAYMGLRQKEWRDEEDVPDVDVEYALEGSF